MKLLGLLLLATMPAAAQYSVHHEGEVIRLEDARTQTVVSVMPSHGNSAFDMRVKGKKVLQFPFATDQEYKAGGGMSGIPFLAPWANRLDEPAFYANGKKYLFNL
jgi:aldose 1-epimerase